MPNLPETVEARLSLSAAAARNLATATVTLDAGNGTIHLLTAQDSRQVQTSDQSSGTMFQSMSMSAQTDTATRYNQLSAGQLAIGAGQIHVQGTAADLQAQALQLAGQPGLAWMGQLANDPRIDWLQVAEIHDQWSKSHSGLSQAGSLQGRSAAGGHGRRNLFCRVRID